MIGCGAPEIGDDALGLLVVRDARDRLSAIPGVEVLEAVGPLDVVHLLEDVDAAIVVDAVRDPSGVRPPGTIVRAEAGPDGLPADVRSSLSSHGLGVAEAVGLAAALGPAPRVVLLGAEVGDLTAGHPLSPPVATILPELVEQVVAEAESLSRKPSGP